MLSEAKQILSAFASRIPPTILGPERVRFITESIHLLPQEHQLILYSLINHILAIMLERNASDIEIGG
ncbi:MAG: twitching motility protein PilT, partial [Ignavibacteria bacterium]|nr:twitching motility protein PilT [Ignavibacteria bacterium]